MKRLSLTLLFAIQCSAALTPAPPPPPKAQLKRVWGEYQAKFADEIKPHQETYLNALEKLEAEAMHNKDAVIAAVIRKERESRDPGLAPLNLPDKSASPQAAELRQLRSEFEKDREKVTKGLNSWCQEQLEPIEKAYMDRNDPISAAVIHVEIEALSKPLLEIVRASYGAGRRFDVTLPLRRAIRFNRVEVAGGNNLAGDPAPYRRKGGSVTFRIGAAEPKTVRFGEAGKIKIP